MRRRAQNLAVPMHPNLTRGAGAGSGRRRGRRARLSDGAARQRQPEARAPKRETVRVWVDITDASHVVFFAPIVRRLEDAGHTVTLTARRFAGADTVLRRYGLGGVLTTAHRGGGIGTRAVGLVNRTAQLLGSASSGRYDVAAGSHASDFALTAWTLGIPQMTFLDDERLRRSNAVNVRLVDEVAVPEASRRRRSPPSARRPTSCSGIRASRRSTTSTTCAPTRRRSRVSASTGGASSAWCARRRRRAAGAATCAAGDEPRSPASSRDLAGRRNVTLVLVARDREQRARFLALRRRRPRRARTDPWTA